MTALLVIAAVVLFAICVRNAYVDKHRVRRCRECGCTDAKACWPTCWWVEYDLCSSCKAGVRR